MDYVLTPLSIAELKTFFDDTALKAIRYFLKKSILSQPEKLLTQIDDLPFQIPKEHIEQWTAQALGVTPSGSGSYPVDVIAADWGADVKMLTCKSDKNGELTNADSGETSLAQKFGDGNFGDGNTLDNLFANQKYEFIWNKWQDILTAKYKKVECDHNITNIYYFIFLKADNIFYLCGMRVDLSKLENTTVNANRTTKDSIWIKDFIDDDFGHIKIYKAKKRLELRLKPKKWLDSKMLLSFNADLKQTGINIREKIINNEMEAYINDVLLSALKNTID